jgi:hypothetical protein
MAPPLPNTLPIPSPFPTPPVGIPCDGAVGLSGTGKDRLGPTPSDGGGTSLTRLVVATGIGIFGSSAAGSPGGLGGAAKVGNGGSDRTIRAESESEDTGIGILGGSLPNEAGVGGGEISGRCTSVGFWRRAIVCNVVGASIDCGLVRFRSKASTLCTKRLFQAAFLGSVRILPRN